MSSVPGGIFTALITPCGDDGAPDLDAVRALVSFQAEAGVSGLFVLGTAGGGPLLDDRERDTLARTILDAAAGRLFVIVHVGALPTSKAARLAREAKQAGAPAIAAVPPVYYQPDFKSVRRYYERIAVAASDTPLLAYNNPLATGYDLRPEQAAELFRDGIIAGVKQASTSVKDMHSLLAAGVPVWIANAGLNIAALAMGARGAISTLTNVVPELFVRLDVAIREGDLVTARDSQARIDRASACLRVPIIGALHAGATLRGLPGGAPREPLRLPEPDELERVR
ncbi:MAG: dihydrodipicolinate synthase family protein [Chloroflexota bacterium]